MNAAAHSQRVVGTCCDTCRGAHADEWSCVVVFWNKSTMPVWRAIGRSRAALIQTIELGCGHARIHICAATVAACENWVDTDGEHPTAVMVWDVVIAMFFNYERTPLRARSSQLAVRRAVWEPRFECRCGRGRIDVFLVNGQLTTARWYM